MSVRERPFDRARRLAARDLRRFGEEVRQARRHHGLSQQALATACCLDQAQVSRIERALNRRPDPGVLYCLALCVGLDAALRTYLGGDPLRDAGHLRLLDRLRRRLHPELRRRTEIPLPVSGDRRAWDAGIYGSNWWRPVEAETVVDDDQALQRRLRLKRRDGHVDGLVLLVADTPRNRAALASADGLLADLSLCSREILAALKAGDAPPSGIVVL